MSLTVAYLVNQYPKVSHSFIRREILALEEHGIIVKRYSIRDCESELVDELDQAELSKTCVLLKQGLTTFLMDVTKTALLNPKRFISTLKLTWKIGKRSERGLLFNLIYFTEACVFFQKLRTTKVSHIHAHFGTNSTTVAMLCHTLGGPAYSFTVHGPEEFDKVEAIALPEKIRHAKFVVAISSFGKSQLYRWTALTDWPKINVVHCGLERNDQGYSPIPDQPQFVCVGRLSAQKGHLLLMEAVRVLVNEGVKLKLIFVGDGELRSQIESYIDRNQLEPYIEITGWASSSEVANHIKASRAMVLPSFAEGLPVVIMESLALSRPVLSTYVAGIPELVEPEICGWLIPAGSVQMLVGEMRRVLSMSAAELETMGKAGMEKVFQDHDVAVETLKLAELFKSDDL